MLVEEGAGAGVTIWGDARTEQQGLSIEGRKMAVRWIQNGRISSSLMSIKKGWELRGGRQQIEEEVQDERMTFAVTL